jgi:hypothetical protein
MGQGNDPISLYNYGETGIPQQYTQGLENLGYLGSPFGGVEKSFQSQIQFQQLMKSMLDQQIGAFNNGNNINALPFNMRNLFNSAAPLLTDPMYGIMGAPGMLSNGYQQGALPNAPSWAYRSWKEQSQGYPDFPAPNALYGAGNSYYGGGATSPSQVATMSPMQQNPNTGSNSGPGGSYAAQAAQNADSGTHQGLDSSGNAYTINSTYGNMTDQQKNDANNFAHQMTG